MLTKICVVKSMFFFSVVMYRCESWTIKKAECQRTDATELWCWRRFLRVPWTTDQIGIKPVSPKGNKPWIFIGRTDAEAEVPILCPPDAKSQLTGKDPDAGKNWRQKEKGATEDEIDSITNSMDVSLNELWEIMKNKEAWCAAVHGLTKSWTQLSDRTTTKPNLGKFSSLGLRSKP